MADIAGVNGTREHFRVVGQPNIPGKLSYALAAGIAKFGVDYVLPDMLHAKFLRSPYANARIVRIDTARAKACPGVIDVITWEDEEIKNLKSFGESFGPARPWLDNLADREGQEVGAIAVAESEQACEEALRNLDIEWDVKPFVVDILEGRKEEAPVIRPEVTEPVGFGGYSGVEYLPKKGNVNTTVMSSGNLEEGFAEAAHILEFDLYIPAFASHMPNPAGSVAWWADDFYGGEGKTLHIEGAVRERHAIAAMYDMPIDKTKQEGLFMGGRYCDWGLRKSQEITPLLARRL